MTNEPASSESQEHSLKKTLGPLTIWGLGVGYVISGEYFGWNLGLPYGGPLGMLVATLLVTVMYVAFVLSYAEVACAIPRAGGAFVYADRAFGTTVGFITGVAQLIEFVFAPPAIAFAIGAYLQTYFPMFPVWAFAVLAFFLFTGLNIWGVQQSAIFELVITIMAVVGLLLFAGFTLPHFDLANFNRNALPSGWGGVLSALPFAIWFYLAIEGLANVAEEAREPQRDISRGFIYAMITLVALVLLVFFSAIGVAGWEAIVYDASGSESDSPLPLALASVVGREHFAYHVVVIMGLFGLVASFHGIMLVAGRAMFEFGRVGYLPSILGQTLSHRQTPAAALIANMLIGFVALATGQTGELITLSAFGALTLYGLAMLSLFRLRQKEPGLHRPYSTPLYPYLPATAALLAVACFIAMLISNPGIGGIFVGIVLSSVLVFRALGFHKRGLPQ
ncbi:MAG TPA: ethanolamine permease [Acidobacteria bacterium]|nr:ethanolamine permease [Acidobacteriota bacterium]